MRVDIGVWVVRGTVGCYRCFWRAELNLFDTELLDRVATRNAFLWGFCPFCMADTDETARDMLSHVLLPVASVDDATATAAALTAYDPGEVTVLHVIEKGEGVPDKTPVEQSEEIAEAAAEAVRAEFPDAELYTAYSRDVVSEIFDAADEIDASAIAYRSRGGNRLVQFLSGDLSLKLVTQADRPVIALPRNGADPGDDAAATDL